MESENSHSENNHENSLSSRNGRIWWEKVSGFALYFYFICNSCDFSFQDRSSLGENGILSLMENQSHSGSYVDVAETSTQL